jgi:hypothetical protein
MSLKDKMDLIQNQSLMLKMISTQMQPRTLTTHQLQTRVESMMRRMFLWKRRAKKSHLLKNQMRIERRWKFRSRSLLRGSPLSS